MNTRAALAADMEAFLARGGKVSKVQPEARSGVIEQAYAEARMFEAGIDPASVRVDRGYAVFNGQGEALYLGE